MKIFHLKPLSWQLSLDYVGSLNAPINREYLATFRVLNNCENVQDTAALKTSPKALCMD